MIGQTISHYRIVEKIGEGGMGVVYRAHDTTLDRDVALKFLPTHLIDSDESKKRFHNEARSASALDHPNICTIYEFGEHNGQPYMAMGLVEGTTLEKRMKESSLSFEQAMEVAKQISRGLAVAHAKGIIHRDLKPANIMIDPHGVVKIMDFGLARREDRTQFTRSGSTLGTLAYMSPDQVKGEAVDARSDLWSLGVVLFEMIMGRRPFSGDYDAAVLHKILNEHPEDIAALQSLSGPLFSLIEALLEKDSEDRIPNAEEVLNRLNKIPTGEVSLIAKGTRPTVSVAAKGSFTTRLIREMRRRKFLPIVGSYLAVAIGMLEVVPYVINQYNLDPGWHQVSLIWVLSGFPLAALIAYFHGRRGPDRVSKSEILLFSCVILIAAGFSFLSWQASRRQANQVVQPQADTGLVEADVDLSDLQKEVATARREMQEEKSAAEQANAETRAQGSFRFGLRKEKEGNERNAEETLEGLTAAVQAYSDARDSFKQARAEAVAEDRQLAKAELDRQVASARTEMLNAKFSVPGSQSQKNADPQYQQAIAEEGNGDTHFGSGNLHAALANFREAATLYLRAKENFASFQKKEADDAKQSMLAAKEKVPRRIYGRKEYGDALQLESDGNSAYNLDEFDRAKGLYKDAELKYSQLVAQFAMDTRRISETVAEGKTTIEIGVRSVIARFKRGLEQQDLQGVRALFKEMTKEEERKWTETFKRIKIQRVNIAAEKTELHDNVATVDVLVRIMWVDNKNRRRPVITYAYTWNIEQIDGQWLIASYQTR
jgi:hypothetical protein